ncbi:MAG: hypothetical protein WC100_20990 [Sterolibacterium sp.]
MTGMRHQRRKEFLESLLVLGRHLGKVQTQAKTALLGREHAADDLALRLENLRRILGIARIEHEKKVSFMADLNVATGNKGNAIAADIQALALNRVAFAIVLNGERCAQSLAIPRT